MKKIICVLLIFLLSFTWTGCFHDIYVNSLDEFLSTMENPEPGYSDVGLDFRCVPSRTFFNDYPYIEGEFLYCEEDSFRALFDKTNSQPDIAFIYLRYKEEVYNEAKQYVLQWINAIDAQYYTYGDYYFYENPYYKTSHGYPTIAESFVMAGYNDRMRTLIFMGLYSPAFFTGKSRLLEKFQNKSDLQEIWVDLVDTYYGEYYNFKE